MLAHVLSATCRPGNGRILFRRTVGVVVRATVVRRLLGIRRQWIGGENKRPSLIDWHRLRLCGVSIKTRLFRFARIRVRAGDVSSRPIARCATRLSTMLSMAHVLAHRSRYKRAPRRCKSALRMRFETACAFIRLLRHYLNYRTRARKDRRIHAACSRYVQAHTTLASLRMSRVAHAFSVRVRIRTHVESCAHAAAFT